MEQHRPKVGIGVFVMKDEHFLMGLRKGSHGEGTWCFPGGHLEYGESWVDCARRETMEETGVEIHNIRHVATTNDIFIAEQKHYITLFMMADYVSGEVEMREPETCLEWRWFGWGELPENTFLPILNLRNSGFDPYCLYSKKKAA